MNGNNKIRGLSVDFWGKLKDITTNKLNNNDMIDILFKNPPKNDGSYLKAKGSNPYTNWAYAVKLAEVWLEFEIKPIKKEKQHDLYDHLLSNRMNIEKKLGDLLRWNKADIEISNRRKTGKDFRIKLISNYDLEEIPDNEEVVLQEWSGDMVKFISSISPYLPPITT